MSRFKTLLLREWMQHHRGWLAVMLVPPVLILAVLLFAGGKHIVLAGNEMEVEVHDPAKLWLGITFAVTSIVFAITCIVVGLQAPGIARRDQQDRSIEFWVSLPTPHAESLGATLLMHTLLVPLLGLTLGYLCSQLIAVLVVILASGVSGLAAVPWTAFLVGGVLTFLRVAAGVALACLWLLPMVLLAMAASAWLKRWGVPVLIAALVAGHVVLSKVYGIDIVAETIGGLWANALTSLIHGQPPGWTGAGGPVFGQDWPVTGQWLAQDAFASLRELATPIFVFALAMSAGCFALLVLRRKRG